MFGNYCFFTLKHDGINQKILPNYNYLYSAQLSKSTKKIPVLVPSII